MVLAELHSICNTSICCRKLYVGVVLCCEHDISALLELSYVDIHVLLRVTKHLLVLPGTAMYCLPLGL
jgi:hypothetical protein